MGAKFFFKIRIYFVALVAIAIGSLLAWNNYNGGVPSHHILADKNLPSISNWWGGLLLPLLAWFLSYRIQKRIFRIHHENSELTGHVSYVIFGFAGSLIYGILISVFFTLGYEDVTGNMFLIIFLIALFIPVYRAEYLLGFVIGMTFTFGAVLPTGIGSILAALGALLFLFVRPAIVYVASRLKLV